jgi:26S proteasome regulatory subunit N12
MYTLLGLNLLCLLAQNRIADFHTQLELIDADQLHSNIYIKHPVQLEQCLMEGSYNKVYRARSDVPAEEYLFFMDMLMGTIRNEIASCFEKAYVTLPLADASTLLHFANSSELMAFIQEVSISLILIPDFYFSAAGK